MEVNFVRYRSLQYFLFNELYYKESLTLYFVSYFSTVSTRDIFISYDLGTA